MNPWIRGGRGTNLGLQRWVAAAGDTDVEPGVGAQRSCRSKQNPGGAVALLAASAVMAETIPPCINLIILGFVANLSIGGLFVAGLLPAALMALVLIAVSIIFGKRPAVSHTGEVTALRSRR